MAEALGGVASVLTIVEAVANVTKLIISCKSATKESRRLVRELSYIRGLFTTLEETIREQESSNDTWTSTLLLLNDNNGLLHQFEQLLGLLESRIRGASSERGLKKIKRVLEWPFKEPEALKLIEAVERYKSLIELALENNHIRLSKAIRDEVKEVSGLVRDILREVEHGNQELREVQSEITGSRAEWQQTSQRLESQIDQSNQQLRKVHSEITGSRQEWQETSRHIEKLGRRADDADSEEIFKRLSSWNFWIRQRDVLSQRVRQTGNWFLTTKEFAEWKSDKGAWLICHGAPGIGKSVLASVIVDHLQANASSNSRVLAFYFDRAYQPNNRYEHFLGSLLQQSLRDESSSWDTLKNSFQKDRHGLELTAADLRTLLKKELQETEKTYLIIDALDEWSTDASDLFTIISDLSTLGDNVSILITSRPLSPHGQLFQNKTEMDLQPPITDLEDYVRSRLVSQCNSGFLKNDQSLQDLITHTILEKCDGLFLLARLQMDLLKGKASKRALLNTLRQLPRTPESLYDDIMLRLETQNSVEVNLARQTFAWVLHAREPPHLHLIQYALAIEPNDVVIDEDGIVDWNTLVSICGGLVVSDSEALTVRFVHPTTRSYFQEYFERQPYSSEAFLTSTCLTFLMSTTFQDCVTEEMRAGEFGYPSGGQTHMTTFLKYASRYLISHYRATENDKTSRCNMEILFNDTTCLANFWLVLQLYSVELFGWYLPSMQDADRLCIACFHGIKHVVSKLLQSGVSPNEKDATGQRPLYAAARQGETEVVRILLDHGGQPELSSFDDPSLPVKQSDEWTLRHTPLECALRQGHLSLARILVDHGVDWGKSESKRSTNLLLAIGSHSRQMVEFVLQQHPFESFLVAGHEDRAIKYALDIGAVDAFELFFKYGMSTTSTFERGLLSALGSIIQARRDCSVACNLILDHMTPEQLERAKDEVFARCRPSSFLQFNRTDVLTNLKKRLWRNRYNDGSAAFGSLWHSLCRSLPEKAATIAKDLQLRTVSSAEFERSNVLLFSVYRGWRDVVAHLLDMADALRCSPAVKSTALSEAIQCSQYDLLPVILRHQPDLNAVLPSGNILCAAILSQQLDVVQLILKAGASPNARCPIFGSAMHAVCCDQQSTIPYTLSVVRLLIEHGAGLDLVYDDRGTVLTALAEISSEKSLALMRDLLNQGADCNAIGGTYHTPLIASAASSGEQSVRIMYLLHATGAELNASAELFGTALMAAFEPTASYSCLKIFNLFEWGADATIPGPKGTLVELAAQSPHAAVRGLVQSQYGGDNQNYLQEALIAAAASGQNETMIQLIEAGADVDVEIDVGGTVLTPLTAALRTDHSETIQTVGLLLAYGARLNAPINGYSNPLQMYLDRSMVEYTVVELMLNSGVDINAPTMPDGFGTASEIAVRRYKESQEPQRELWRMILQLLHRHEVAYSDQDFNFFMEQSWFVQFVTLEMGDMMDCD